MVSVTPTILTGPLAHVCPVTSETGKTPPRGETQDYRRVVRLLPGDTNVFTAQPWYLVRDLTLSVRRRRKTLLLSRDGARLTFKGVDILTTKRVIYLHLNETNLTSNVRSFGPKCTKGFVHPYTVGLREKVTKELPCRLRNRNRNT